MIILKHTYQTSLSKEQIENWIKLKKNEKFDFIKSKKYIVDSKENTFRIRRRRTNKQQPFFAQVTGKYNFQGNNVFIKIRQSIYGTFFFGLFWGAIPIAFLFKDKTPINEQLKTLYSNENLISGFLIIGFLTIMTYFFLIRTIYKMRDWIEFELKLNNRSNE